MICMFIRSALYPRTVAHAALRASLDPDTDLRVIEGYRLTEGVLRCGSRTSHSETAIATLWTSFSSAHEAATGMFFGRHRRRKTPQLVRCGWRMLAAPIGYLVWHVAGLAGVLAGLAHACRSVVAG